MVLYSGRKLFSEATEPHRFFLEQAVDFEHFSNLKVEPAPELGSIPHPILGYFGAMDCVMDTELMAEVARLRPAGTGCYSASSQTWCRYAAPNIHFWAPNPMPTCRATFDTSTCAFCPGGEQPFTSYGSAIKVREYLATGKPVVMAPLYEYLEIPGLRFRGTQEFIAQVEAALQENSAALAARRLSGG